MLQLDRRQHARIVRRAQILPSHRTPPIRHDRRADERVRLAGPPRRGGHRIFEVNALEPSRGQVLVRAGLDVGRQRSGPLLRIGERRAAGVLLGDGGVPHGVQVCGCPGEGDRHVVAAEIVVLVVQRLVDVADEVDDEHEGFVDVCAAELGVLDTGGLGEWCQQESLVEESRRVST